MVSGNCDRFRIDQNGIGISVPGGQVLPPLLDLILIGGLNDLPLSVHCVADCLFGQTLLLEFFFIQTVSS